MRRLSTVLKWALLVFVLVTAGVFGWGWYHVFGPMPKTLDTVRSMTELPVPDSATIVGMRTERFLRPNIDARLRMPPDDFERWREELPFDLTRDPDTVNLARDWLRWPGRKDARPPDWWRPDDLQDPLAACDGFPVADAGEDEWPNHHIRLLAEEQPDGMVDVYLYDLVD